MALRREPILTFVFLSQVFFIAITAVGIDQQEETLFWQLILPVYAILLVSLIAEFLTRKESIFLIFSTVHLVALLMLFKSVGYDKPFVLVALSFFLYLNNALKLNQIKSVLFNITALVLIVSAVFGRNGHGLWRPSYFFFVSLLLFVFSQMVAYYREELIAYRNLAREKDLSIDKLETVSESLLQHLTEIREESAEEERFRITRELHDSLGYSMTNIVSIMNAAQYLFEEDPDRVKGYCEKTKDLAASTMEETRSTLYKLREITRDIPANPAFFFDKMCRDFQEATGIVTQCEGGNFTERPPERIFSTVYRIVQVGFINALKHGETENIKLYFWVDRDELRMTIWNNINRIVSPSRLEEGIGLKGVRERLTIFGGELAINQTLDGFSLNVTLPLTNAGEEEWKP